MSFGELEDAVTWGNVKTVRELLFENSKFLDVPLDSKFVNSVVTLILDNNTTKEVSDLLVKFIESGSNDKLERNFIAAILRGDLQSVESLLLNGASEIVKNQKWGTLDLPLLYKIILLRRNCNRKETLKLLIKYGLNTRVRGEYGENLIHKFILLSSTYIFDLEKEEIVEILIDSGIPVDECTNDGTSVLYFAVEVNNIKMISFLLEKGVDVNNVNFKKESALNSSVRFGNVDLVDLFVKNGADINVKNDSDNTPLHTACFYHRKEVIDYLLQKGADSCAINKMDRTPFFYLHPEDSSDDQCVLLMVKEFSKLSFDKGSISKSDMDLIVQNPILHTYLKKCLTELDHMASNKFYVPYSYGCILKMSQNIKKLAYLTNNQKFLVAFEGNLQQYSHYKDDLHRILADAIKVRDKLQIVETRLKSTFNECPEVIIILLAEYLTVEDLPLQ